MGTHHPGAVRLGPEQEALAPLLVWSRALRLFLGGSHPCVARLRFTEARKNLVGQMESR